MKVTHISTVHARSDVRIFLKECRSLANEGHNVSLICADGLGDAVEDGVAIYDVGAPCSRFDRAVNATHRIGIKIRQLRPSFVHFHDPELIGLGMRLSRQGFKVIYDVHENVPADVATKKWIPWGLRGATALALGSAELLGCRYFYKIVAATPAIAHRFPSEKTVIVQNYPFPSELLGSNTPYSGRLPHFIYAGGITYERGFRQMVIAANLAAREQELYLRLAGSLEDPSNMINTMANYSNGNFVIYEGVLKRQHMAEMFSEARAGLVLFQPHKNHVDAQPNKIFEYMSAGLPIIAANFPLWREIIEGGQCGICVDPRREVDIADAMIWILKNPEEAAAMGKRGRALVNDRYNWSSQIPALLSAYE